MFVPFLTLNISVTGLVALLFAFNGDMVGPRITNMVELL
jgi:hypothetical protein